MSESRDMLSAAAGEILSAATDELVDELSAWYAERIPGLGARGLAACKEDTRSHLEHLRSALIAGRHEPFALYAGWLGEVLAARNIPITHLPEALRRLGVLIGRRLPPDDAERVAALLEAGAVAAEHPDRLHTAMDANGPQPLAEMEDFCALLLQGDGRAAGRLARGLMDRGVAPQDLAVRLLQPCLYRIGVYWQQNRISVAQEHLATAIAQNILAQAFARAQFARPTGHKALFACVPGNAHSLGLRMVSDAFEMRGWSVQFLGADTPVDALIRQIESWRPDLVGLSVSVIQQFSTLRQVIERLRAAFGEACPTIMAGGLATNVAEDVWQGSGAELWAANALEAPRLAEELL